LARSELDERSLDIKLRRTINLKKRGKGSWTTRYKKTTCVCQVPRLRRQAPEVSESVRGRVERVILQAGQELLSLIPNTLLSPPLQCSINDRVPLRLLGSMRLIGNGTASHAGLTCQPDPTHTLVRLIAGKTLPSGCDDLFPLSNFPPYETMGVLCSGPR
jgi:hypothetical protein